MQREASPSCLTSVAQPIGAPMPMPLQCVFQARCRSHREVPTPRVALQRVSLVMRVMLDAVVVLFLLCSVAYVIPYLRLAREVHLALALVSGRQRRLGFSVFDVRLALGWAKGI